MADNINDKNISEFNSGIYSDSSPLNQPKGTQRFALNMVNASNEVNSENSIKNNENSNQEYVNLTPGYVPIGKVYIENNNILIFSVKEDNTTSEIGIMDDYGKYTVLVNTNVLGFKVENQIQATYRLRRGCERNVYFVDNYNVPRFINIDSLSSFKDTAGNWVADKFALIKTPKYIPKFENVEVQEGNGSLPPGSYTISIQYVDANQNATDWLNETNPIIIYNSLLTDDYKNIAGSFYTYSALSDLASGKTSKSIKIKVSNLDTNFLYYRLAFSIATSGSGAATKAVMTDTISIENDTYLFSTLDNTTETTLEELVFEKTLINRAKTIEQHENLLLLGNIRGWEGNLCKLQKYASKIKADCIVRKVSATSIKDSGNIKSPVVNVSDILGSIGNGYMPGEVYSFGIVYIFKSGYVSPVFHIPGRSSSASEGTYKKVTDSDGNTITFPMNTTNNSCDSSLYPNIGSCNNSDYWGFDCEGNSLVGTKIRHHQFPERGTINKPLIEVPDEGEESKSNKYISLKVELESTRPAATTNYPDSGEIRITYQVSTETSTREMSIDFSAKSFFLPDSSPLTISSPRFLVTDSTQTITIVSADMLIYTDNGDNTFTPSRISLPETLTTITSSTVTEEEALSTRAYKTNRLGIIFSNIELPTSEDLGIENGDSVIGYYIVRNERTEDNKIIVDSGVMTPCIGATSSDRALGYDSYIAPSLLMPQFNSGVGKGEVVSNMWNIITPRHKFKGEKLTSGLYDIQQQGNFTRTYPTGSDNYSQYSRTRYSDVLDGSTFTANGSNLDKFSEKSLDNGNTGGSPHKKGADGWCFKMACRDNLLSMKSVNGWTIKASEQEKIHTLKGMEYEASSLDSSRCVYNSQTDQINQILELKSGSEKTYSGNDLPFVVIKKSVGEPYATFFTLPYYKETTNYLESNTCEIFNGDAYVAPLRYNSVVKVQNRPVQLLAESQLSTVWGWIAAIELIAAGTALSVITGTLGSSIWIAIGAALSAIGGAIWSVTTVLESQEWIDNYNKAYEDGLQKTVSDDWTYKEFEPKVNNGWWGYFDSPSDDEIEYAADCLTDLWFETEVNIGLRVKSSDESYLGSPGELESGCNWYELVSKIKDTGGIFQTATSVKWLWTRAVSSPYGSYRQPKSLLEHLANNKCLTVDLDRNHDKKYLGTSMGESYLLNPDLEIRHGVKSYTHLPQTYECCSDCVEEFPHRFCWSEQSFQEELVDNYGLFKANNYRDLDGETGEIMNIFKIKDHLFIHTREALWEVPKNQQEIVNDQIISFIGTGTLYDIPPRKIIEDNNGMSAGIWHRESALLTEYGYFFVCEKQCKIFLFNGSQLTAISSIGLANWFKDNIRIKLASDYEKILGREYPYNDNPSNKYGCGFISTYDSYKRRIIFTKKDYKFNDNVIGSNDFELCIKDGKLIFAKDYLQTINYWETKAIPESEYSNYLSETVYPMSEWRYLGIEDCKMKFERDIKIQKTEKKYVTKTLPSDTIIIMDYDTSGSLTEAQLYTTKRNLVSWYISFRPSDPITETPIRTIPNQTGTVQITTGNFDYFFPSDATKTEVTAAMDTLYAASDLLQHVKFSEKYLQSIAKLSVDYSGKDVLYICTVNEHAEYAPIDDTWKMTGQPSTDYLTDYIKLNLSSFKSFIGFFMPIYTGGFYSDFTLAYIQHIIAVVSGKIITAEEFAKIDANSSYISEEWNSIAPALVNNPYINTEGDEEFDNSLNNWCKIYDKVKFGFRVNRSFNDPPTPEDFASDMDELLAGSHTEEEVDVTTYTMATDYMYIEGEEIDNPLKYNNSWTMSFDVDAKKWISWHSYLPSMYFHVANKFYSWKYGIDKIWKHNIEGNYQTFYGTLYPFIVEYISLSNPLVTKLWDAIQLICDAEKYDKDNNEFIDSAIIFFNKVIAYNSRQCTGELNIKVKNENIKDDYLYEQINNLLPNEIIANKSEKTWNLNGFRDIRIDYDQSIFISNPINLQAKYFIDKILNQNSIDFNKDWTQLEGLRDKYLALRFIFDKFADVKLSLNFSTENEITSIR